ncbi:MAG: hypothetical protein FWD29_06395 [Micrococcales bacterium]|nr:hypothetical protein [Micrococcales bacterium]
MDWVPGIVSVPAVPPGVVAESMVSSAPAGTLILEFRVLVPCSRTVRLAPLVTVTTPLELMPSKVTVVVVPLLMVTGTFAARAGLEFHRR